MTVLVDHQISKLVEHGQVEIEPFRPGRVNPASYDVSLGQYIASEHNLRHPLDLAMLHQEQMDEFSMPTSGYVLAPREFILAATEERIRIPRTLVARVEGKSSLGRIGLAVHVTAGFIDPGFEGYVTLEIVNLSRRPIVIYPGMRVAQLAFQRTDVLPSKSYADTGHYQDQGPGPVQSRYQFKAEEDQ